MAMETGSKQRRTTDITSLRSGHSFYDEEDGEQQPLVVQKRNSTALDSFRHWRKSQWTPEKSMGTAKMSVLIMSAFANIAPVGCMVVSRPTGGIIPSLLILAFFGALSLFTAHLVAYALTITGCHSLRELWRETCGGRTAWVPTCCVACACFACCIGYADFYGHLLASVWPIRPFPDVFKKSEDFYIVASAVFPMSVIVCLKDIRMMRWSTLVSGISCTFAVVVAVWRYLDGSYGRKHHWPGGRPTNEWSASDWLGYRETPFDLGAVQAVMFLYHFNAAKYFRELENPRKQSYTAGVGVAIGTGYVVVAIMMIFVFLTFGKSTKLLALDNYAMDDKLANVARFACSVGIMGCFPLVFAGLREAILELLGDAWPSQERELFSTLLFQNVLSVALLITTVLVATSPGRGDKLINNIGRSVFGSLLIYVIPCLVFRGATAKHTSASFVPWWKTALLVVLVILGLGVSLGSAISFCVFV